MKGFSVEQEREILEAYYFRKQFMNNHKAMQKAIRVVIPPESLNGGIVDKVKHYDSIYNHIMRQQLRVGDIVEFKDLKLYNETKEIKGDGVLHIITEITEEYIQLKNEHTNEYIMTQPNALVESKNKQLKLF